MMKARAIARLRLPTLIQYPSYKRNVGEGFCGVIMFMLTISAVQPNVAAAVVRLLAEYQTQYIRTNGYRIEV